MATMIYGTVYDSGTTKLTDAVVTIPGFIVTNSSGIYSATVIGGNYNVTATCANYQQQTILVVVGPGQMKMQDFHLTHV